MPSSEELAKALRAVPFLSDVAPAAVERLAGEGTLQHLPRGRVLFRQGDRSLAAYVLLEGRLEITSTSLSGHRQWHTALDPPQLFGELGVLGAVTRSADVRTIESSSVWRLDGERFLEFLARQPAASIALLGTLARQVNASGGLVDDLLHLDLRGRVAKRLLGLVSPSFEEVAPDGVVLPSIVTHADLASLAGGSRENVTRILSDFQRRGLVERIGRRYALTDIAGLRQLAGLETSRPDTQQEIRRRGM